MLGVSPSSFAKQVLCKFHSVFLPNRYFLDTTKVECYVLDFCDFQQPYPYVKSDVWFSLEWQNDMHITCPK